MGRRASNQPSSYACILNGNFDTSGHLGRASDLWFSSRARGHPPNVDPLVFAHRGGAHAPEHSLDAYRRSLDLGVDGLECDVRLTSDMVPVCVHDRRIDRVSSGRGGVRRFTYRELRDMDFGGSSILDLATLVELVLDHPAKARLLVEVKVPTRGAEAALVDVLRGYGKPSELPVEFMSFSPFVLERLFALEPDVPRTILFGMRTLKPRLSPHPTLGPSIAFVRRNLPWVRRIQASGGRIRSWVVNSGPDIDLALGLGIEIITDHPATLLARRERGAG